MPLQPIKDVGDNAFKGGFLDLAYCKIVVMFLNLLLKMRVVLPSSKFGSAKFLVAEDGIVLDMTKTKFGTGSDILYSLQLIDASKEGVAKITMRDGSVHNGSVAETTFTVTNGHKQWVQFAVSYDTGTGSWIADNSTRTAQSGASLPAESDSLAVCPIGSVTVVSGRVTAIKRADGTGSAQNLYGPVFWSRPGGPDDFESDWISPGP